MIPDIPGPPPGPSGQVSGVTKEAAAAALDRIIHSKTLGEAPRLRRLLEFIVRESLSGKGAELKETVLAIEIFGKPHNFDPRVDASVRVAANRLRAKLKGYYETEGSGESIRIALPEGHYTARFSARRTRPSEDCTIPRPCRVAGFEARTFVGRHAELEQLADHLARSVEGRGHMVSIVAEPGIGKTALIEAFLETQHCNREIACAVGRCRQELEHTESYLPWIEILEELAGEESSTEALLQASAPTWWNHLRLQNPDGCVQQESSVKREMQRFLQAFTARRPLLLVIEDLHWADTSTVDLIGYLGSALPSLRVLLLVSYRPSALRLAGSPFLKVDPELKMHRVCEDLPLGELSLSDARQYLELRFPGNAFSPDFAHDLQTRSEGNALCLTALVDHAVERNWIAFRDGRWWLAMPVDIWDRELPASVRSMVAVKLTALSESDRELLSAAAVLGMECDSEVLSRALSLDTSFVEERLAAFHSMHRLLRRRGGSHVPARLAGGYQFAHVLYQEALLKDIEPARYRRLCSALAGAIITCRGGAEANIAGNVARLLREAGLGEPALPYYARAAAHAVQLSAYRQAFDLAYQAADIARQCSPTEVIRRFEIEFLTTQAVALTSLEGFAAAEIEEIYRRARGVASELGDLTAVTSIAHLHWGLVSIISLERALELADVLRKDADQAENKEAKALAGMAQGIALFHGGSLAGGTVVLRQAVEQWRGIEGALGFRAYMLDPAVATQCNLARALWFVGKPDEAWRTAIDSIELASRIGHHRTTAYAMALAADVAHLRRDVAGTLRWSEKAIEMSREHEFLYEATWAGILQGWAQAWSDDPAQAIKTFERASQYRGPGATKFLCHFAETLGKSNCYDRAFAVLEDAFRLVSGRGERYYVSELQRVQGEITAHSDGPANLVEAERILRDAVHTARQAGAKICELRASSSLARFCLEFHPDVSSRVLDDLKVVLSGAPETANTPDGLEARRVLNW